MLEIMLEIMLEDRLNPLFIDVSESSTEFTGQIQNPRNLPKMS